MSHSVSIIYGDGIGPEVVGATKRIIDATGVKINWEPCEAGAAVFKKGLATGVPQETIDSIVKNKVALKGPLETPVGFGEKSANVTLRKLFETYGNIRPVKEMPGVPTPYAGRGIDLVIVRENIEDLYAGIEYMQTPSVAQCLKLISRKGCEKIVRLAFEYARSSGRKSVACATKANIMKFSEGMLKRTFEDISKDYPDIQSWHVIVDNCAHLLVKKPEQFDIIVTTNMNGDILSDLSSALIGGLGFAPGANIGDDYSIFEAVHGSAPKYAGTNTINPTAVLLSGVMMLRHLNEFEAAASIERALYITMVHDKVLTRDALDNKDLIPATTTQFTDKIIDNLGKDFEGYSPRQHKPLTKLPKLPKDIIKPAVRLHVGADIFIENIEDPATVGQKLEEAVANLPFQLKLITSRGVKIYPTNLIGAQPDLVDLMSCRFVVREEGDVVTDACILKLLEVVGDHVKWCHVERLQLFDGNPSYTKAHGEE